MAGAVRGRHVSRLIAAGVAALAAVAIALWLAGLVPGTAGGNSAPRAAIVDQLQLTSPNPQFVAEAVRTLEEHGYQVDYYPGKAVTVDLYRELPKRGYDLLILRVHSTAQVSRGDEEVKSVSLFTNQPYSQSGYYDEQAAGRIGFANYKDGDGEQYFGVTSSFITDSMKGNFHNTTVVMMGCEGLVNEKAAQAFIEKGATAFVGWDGLVSAEHTDEATLKLLRHMVAERASPEEAIARTMAEVGPDPDFGSQLLAWP